MKKIIFFWCFVAITYLSSTAQSSKITNAAIHFNNGEMEEALTDLNAALASETTKNDPKALYYKVKTLIALANNPKYASKYPNAASDAYQSYKDCQQYDTKNKYMEDLKSSPLQIANLLCGLGINAMRDKKYDDAKQAFGKATNLVPLDVKNPFALQYYSLLGQSAYYAGDVNLAKSTLASLADKGAEDPTVYLTLANLYNNDKNFDQAIAVLQKGKTVNDGLIGKLNRSVDSIKTTKGFNEKNNMYVFMKQGLDACVANKVRMRNEEFNIYIRQGTIGQKVKELETEVQKEPNDPALRYLYGKVLEPKDKDKAALKDFEASITQYNKAIELKPDFYDVLYDLGAIYVREGKNLYDESDKIFMTDKTKSETLGNESKAMFAKALPFLERANDLQANNKEVITTLRSLYIGSGNLEKAALLKCRLESCPTKLYSRKQLENLLVGKKKDDMVKEVGAPKDANGKKNADGTFSILYERISYDGDNFKSPDNAMEVVFQGAQIKELKFQ